MKNKKKLLITLAIIGFIALACLVAASRSSWVTYTETDYGIQLKYPKDWEIVDNLTPKSCCLFIVKYNISTTTAINASGTPMTKVTATERIKLQIGPYDISTYNPFKVASTTKVHIGDNDLYTGLYNGINFYILPQSPTRGIGIAMFAYPETPEEARVTALQVISTIKLVPPTATSTATSTGDR